MSTRKKRAWHFLSQSGKISTRAEAKILLAEGRIELDGRPLSSLDRFINLKKSRLTIDGEIVKPIKKKIYLIFHKPVGVLSSSLKNKDRPTPTVFDLLQKGSQVNETERQTLFCVGRLDLNSSGLIFLTNDGTWAHRILSPSSSTPKVYRAVLDRPLSLLAISALEKGVDIDLEKDGIINRYRTKECKIIPDFSNGVESSTKIKSGHQNQSECQSFRVTLTEGKKRQIRRMFLTVGRKVTQLHRLSIGLVELGNLPVGAFRFLEPREIELLGK